MRLELYPGLRMMQGHRAALASLLYPVVELFEFTVYPPLQCFSVCARRKLVEIVEGGTIPFIFCLFWNLVLMNKSHLGLYSVHYRHHKGR